MDTVEDWQAELDALLADDPFEAHAQAHQKVVAAMSAYREAAARLEAKGVPATTKNPANGFATVAAPLRVLRQQQESALRERREAEQRCQRVDYLRKCIEAGSTHTPFKHYSAPALKPGEAVARGGRRIVRDSKTGQTVIERSDKAPPLPTGAQAWAAERAKRRAEGDARDAERMATIEGNRKRKLGLDD